ncbi:hypothetical protein DFI02_103340 [Rhizobium sp. PP-F2F-G20b]|nr:hypothetical protein C8J32_10379 [Rhizobium sp. PP-CC-3A-592]PYE44187.1 hypothetical protein DFI02_103340 [Rhizobium sp. PP-F2F-G20b]
MRESMPITESTSDTAMDTVADRAGGMGTTVSTTVGMVDMRGSGAAGGIACSTMVNFACFFSR